MLQKSNTFVAKNRIIYIKNRLDYDVPCMDMAIRTVATFLLE
jgi:hypothetical protein